MRFLAKDLLIKVRIRTFLDHFMAMWFEEEKDEIQNKKHSI